MSQPEILTKCLGPDCARFESGLFVIPDWAGDRENPGSEGCTAMLEARITEADKEPARKCIFLEPQSLVGLSESTKALLTAASARLAARGAATGGQV